MTEDLSMLTDTLNEVLERCEKAFKARRWGVSASIQLTSGPELAFRKLGDAWKLCVSNDSPTTPWVALLSSARAMRVEAAKVMPALYEALKDEAHCQELHLRATVEELGAFVEAVESELQEAGR